MKNADLKKKDSGEIASLKAELFRYRSLVEENPAMICRFLPDGTLTYVNATYCRYFGQSPQELIGKQFTPLIPPEDHHLIEKLLKELHPKMKPYTHVHRVILPGGEVRWNRWTNSSIHDEEGNFIEYQAMGVDVTEQILAEYRLKHLTRLNSVLSQINQAIIRTRNRITLYQQICEVIVKYGNFRFAWIGIIDENYQQVKPVAYSGSEAHYLKDIVISTKDDKFGKGPTGRAIREGRCVAYNDILNNPDYAPWREQAKKRGFRSSASIPIRLKDKIIGAINLYATEPDFFNRDELKLLEEIGNDVSFAISALEDAQKRAEVEKELRETNIILQSVLNSPDVIIFSLDKEYRYTSFNENHRQTMKKIWGVDIHIGMNMLEAIGSSQDRQKAKQNFDKALSGESFTYEEEYGDPALYRTCYEDSYSPIVDPRGEIIGLTVFVRDITKRKAAEKKFQQHAKMIDQILATSLEGFILADTEGKILDVNASYCEMVGYRREELLEMSIFDMEQSMSADQIRQRIREMVSAGGAKFQTCHRHKNGGMVELEVSITIITRDDTPLVAAFVRDVTEQKKMLEALQASEKSYRELFDNATDAIYIQDREGRFLDVNQGAVKMYGYPREFFIGKTPEPLSAPGKNDLKKVGEMVQKAFEGEPQRFEFWGLRSNGEAFPKEVRLNKGTYMGRDVVIAFAQDITERKRLEEQLLQAQKMEAIGKLAGGVAHDFNNLLTVINGYSDLLLQQISPDDPTYISIQQIQKAGIRATELTAQLLAFSRRQMIQPSILNLNHVVKDTEKMLRRLIGENIILETFLEENLGNIRADMGQMEQIILNLAVNARDAMPRGGKLIIETANVILDDEYTRQHIDVQPGQYVLLAITDTGLGMDTEILPHIFEPFFTTKKVGEGTGLGLSTVYGIVKQNKGNIWVYSEPGEGSTFKIYLPRVDEEISFQNHHQRIPSRLRGTETILIVEDDENVRKLSKEVLLTQGYRVLEAHNGEQAIEIYKQQGETIDLILTDVIMPGMSGKELVDLLLSINAELKVIFFSGYTDNTIVHQGILDEDTHFIQKPFSPLALLEKIRTVLDSL